MERILMQLDIDHGMFDSIVQHLDCFYLQFVNPEYYFPWFDDAAFYPDSLMHPGLITRGVQSVRSFCLWIYPDPETSGSIAMKRYLFDPDPTELYIPRLNLI